MKKSIISMTIIGLLAAPALAVAGTMTGQSTIPNQLAQESLLIQAKKDAAAHLVDSLMQSYNTLSRSSATLPKTKSDKIVQIIGKIYDLSNQTRSIATEGANVSNALEQVKVIGPKIAAPETSQYDSIKDGFNNAVKLALKKAKLNPDNFTTKQQAMQQVESAMQQANSRNAIMQAAVGVGQAEVSALTSLAQTTKVESKKAGITGLTTNLPLFSAASDQT